MAAWCLATGQTPRTWRTLTRLERAAFEAEVNAINERIERQMKG